MFVFVCSFCKKGEAQNEGNQFILLDYFLLFALSSLELAIWSTATYQCQPTLLNPNSIWPMAGGNLRPGSGSATQTLKGGKKKKIYLKCSDNDKNYCTQMLQKLYSYFGLKKLCKYIQTLC